MRFLNRFSQHCDKNKMTLQNLATCWAPNLLRSEDETYDKVLRDASSVNAAIMIMIDHIDEIADDQPAKLKKPGLHKMRSFSDFTKEIKPPVNTENQKLTASTDDLAALGNSTNTQSRWKETLSPDGKKYYYNVDTRQTSWTLPKESSAIDTPPTTSTNNDNNFDNHNNKNDNDNNSKKK